jgi:hypothetical protein
MFLRSPALGFPLVLMLGITVGCGDSESKSDLSSAGAAGTATSGAGNSGAAGSANAGRGGSSPNEAGAAGFGGVPTAGTSGDAGKAGNVTETAGSANAGFGGDAGSSGAGNAGAGASAGDGGFAGSAGSGGAGPSIVMFSTATTGKMGGREGADALCKTEASKHESLKGLRVHAFVCVNEDDEVVDIPSNFDMPTYRPFVSLSQIQVASNWTALQTKLDASLSSAGVMSSNQFFSGCGLNWGTLIAKPANRACSEWTSDVNTEMAATGKSDLTGSDWLSYGNILACNTQLVVVCIAFEAE